MVALRALNQKWRRTMRFAALQQRKPWFEWAAAFRICSVVLQFLRLIVNEVRTSGKSTSYLVQASQVINDHEWPSTVLFSLNFLLDFKSRYKV